MIIFISIIFIIVMIVIIAYIYYNTSKNKSNKKFIFRYKPKRQEINRRVQKQNKSMQQIINEQNYRTDQEYRPNQEYRSNQEYRHDQEYRPNQEDRPDQEDINDQPLLHVNICENNYIWNKYLNKCITTECPMESYTNCNNKAWVLPYDIIPPNPNPDVRVPTNQFRSGMTDISPSLLERISETLNIPIPEEGEVCWSECQNRYVKPECPEMTMEECTTRTLGYGWDNSPMAAQGYNIGKTCKELSNFSPEMQLQTLIPANSGANRNRNVTLPGEDCWSSACQRCVKPYVKPLTPIQSQIKHNQDTTCFPNNRTCIRDTKTGNQWSYSYLSLLGTDIRQTVTVPTETCEEWSTFTNWNKYGLNPLVLPGEVCYNPCTGGCVAPLSY